MMGFYIHLFLGKLCYIYREHEELTGERDPLSIAKQRDNLIENQILNPIN